MYKGLVVDASLLKSDPHFSLGCKFCHQGDDKAMAKEAAHQGLIKKPSDNLKACAMCHKKITDTYAKALHYTTVGQKTGIAHRFSEGERKIFEDRVFEKSCRTCHASCGACHVKAQPVGGIGIGLIKNHKFVKKSEGKTCAFCHGGRVYTEYTGEYGEAPDIHYQKGMLCLDCHQKSELHGDGNAYQSMREVKDRPSCTKCHKLGNEPKLTTRTAHQVHQGKVSCYGCHVASAYRNCSQCHLEIGAKSFPETYLGKSPRNKNVLTTLRLVPTHRNTFQGAGLKMENYDRQPNYWDSPVHNIRKRTDRTQSCDVCHVERRDFLSTEKLIKDGSQENKNLIMKLKDISR
ncbi:MAG TPA: multiheme c-type cytochrome [Syntrophales bacterium]|nr:multiheme c-type cytochrome [Syntrophales bacterium]HOL59573.1 multiheme c-type cytochrome [Syntrophales bacterium]HPO35663.1 multiheme c-type cytochrome [Syntrophales bacterium]